MKAFIIMGRTFKAIYEEMFMWIWLSVLWWISLVPFAITVPPATMGLHYVAHRYANYLRVESGFFWDGARKEIRRGYLLGLIYLLLPATIAFNIWFYGNSQSWWSVISVVWLWVLLLWLLMSQYLFPLFWQQDQPDLRLALRNSALLVVRHPLYSFLIFLFQVLMIVLSFGLVLPLLFLPALVIVSQNLAVIGLLQEMGLAPQPPEPMRD